MRRVVILPIFLFLMAIFWPFSADAGLQEEIDARNQQIEEIQKQIDAYQQQIEESSSREQTLAGEIAQLNAQINKVQLEIKSLDIAIGQTGLEIQDTQTGIQNATDQLQLQKEVLAKYMRILYELDKENLTRVLLSNAKLSDFFNNLKNLGDIQDNLQATIVSIKDLKANLEQNESDLEDKKTELGQLKGLQQVEKSNLNSTTGEKNAILKETKGQEAKFQQLVKQSQQDIARIRDQISYLIQNGITAEEAVKFGQLAAIRTGIRPEYLLAELNQESGLGINVGKCFITDLTSGASRHITTGQVFARGINPTRDLPSFLIITAELGKDPLQTPISCWPGYGWGGAMGPAQFIPSTWMGYRDEVTRLTGHNPANPWSIEDAFVAAAAKLARDGADSKTRAGEIAASKKYFCGNSKSTASNCINYANTVQDKAAIIAQSL